MTTQVYGNNIFRTTIICVDEYVNKVPVKAGYFYNEMYVFYFAEFKLGEFTVHLENCGLKSEREKIKLEFATALYEIISLERIDLTGIMP